MKNKNSLDPLVFVIIVSYNGEKWLTKCFESLFKTVYSNFKVLLVDNASKDKTIELTKRYPKVDVIKNNSNIGFAEGNNIGIRYALRQGAEYITLLNQDTAVDKLWLRTLIDSLQTYHNIGAASPLQLDKDGKNLEESFKVLLSHTPELIIDFNKNVLKPIYYVEKFTGAAFIVPSIVFKNLGAFDPIYLCYFEEMDFLRRINYHGYKIAIIPASNIIHFGRSSFVDNHTYERSRRLLVRNRLIFYLKRPGRMMLINLFEYLTYELVRDLINIIFEKKTWIYPLDLFDFLKIHFSILPKIHYLIERKNFEASSPEKL